MSKTKRAREPGHQLGDVFVAALPSGWFGAARILGWDAERERQGAYLVATSTYLEHASPTLDDPRLRQVLARRYFYWSAQLALVWVRELPADILTYLGNLPLDEDDERARAYCETFGFAGATGRFNEALWQWRWDHDREAIVAEQKAEEEAFYALLKRQRRSQKPKSMLTDDDFWALIGLLGQPAENLDLAMDGYERLVGALTQRNRRDIKKFEETLAYKLYLLDTKAHAERSVGSDDGFLYARCGVVAYGRECFESVRNDPAQMPDDADFEDLLSVASTAYERKTGEELEYETGCSYETGSNITGWPE